MRRALDFLVGNWFARAYLLLVAIFAVLSFAAGRFGGEETSFAAGFLLILLTVPWHCSCLPLLIFHRVGSAR